MKIAVYTAIFGNKDEIKFPLNFSKNNQIDYFLITDNIKIKSEIYKVIYRKSIYHDITKNARYFKIFGLKEFEKYDYVIWHDANLQMYHHKIMDLVNELQGRLMATFSHPLRKCFYDEAIACIYDKKEEPIILFKQIFKYFIKGVPLNMGLYETSILVKDNSTKNFEFKKLWWNELKKLSRRDQIALSYTLFKCPISISSINGERLENSYSLFFEHSHNNYINKSPNYLSEIVSKERIIQWIKFLKILRAKF